MAHMLEASHIVKRYAHHTALDDVSVSIPKQSIFGLLGPNGAGKTTLIRIINQIIMADEGDVAIQGQRLNPDHVKMIGYLPEERGLYKKMKVGEQLMYLARLRGLNRTEASQRIKAWAEKFDMSGWSQKKIQDLSKGMAQKVQFIATVLHEPELLILDEPFSGFDPVNANLIRDNILELREKGATVIFSTHRMESVEQLCDHVALINKSRKVLDGSVADIRTRFRSSTYQLEYEGQLQNLPEEWELSQGQKPLMPNTSTATIKVPESVSSNQVAQALLSQVQIVQFREHIPSMNEIFISQVQEDPTHEQQ